jgi:hypothetical protein
LLRVVVQVALVLVLLVVGVVVLVVYYQAPHQLHQETLIPLLLVLVDQHQRPLNQLVVATLRLMQMEQQ